MVRCPHSPGDDVEFCLAVRMAGAGLLSALPEGIQGCNLDERQQGSKI